MKKIFFAIICILTTFTVSSQPADLNGFKIFINPGHGGLDGDDRHMLNTDFWESEGNLTKGLYLRQILTNMNATVTMSRTTNTTADDLPLSTISTMANQANVDFFLAIHSNGFAGNQNQPLMLYRGYDAQPAYPASKTMAQIMWQKLYENGNCWTSSAAWVKGDFTFYPDWGTQGLGVLRGLTMPGVLSEGSFHDYVPESWRLRNPNFLLHEAWALARSFTDFFNVIPSTMGIIAGIARNPLASPAYYFKAGTNDQAVPVNGLTVTLKPGNKVVTTDNLNNGFFMFDSLVPGTYKLVFDAVQNFLKDSITVEVLANKSTLVNKELIPDTTLIPKIVAFTPVTADSIPLNQEFTIQFDLNMNTDSVAKALQFTPSVKLVYTWLEKNKILKVKPETQFNFNTSYTVNLSTAACSQWKVKISEPISRKYVTINRNKLLLEKSYPSAGQPGLSNRLQIRLFFDAPLLQSSAQQYITLVDNLGNTLPKAQEEFYTNGSKGYYYFEPASPLNLNSTYKIIINENLKDQQGLTIGSAKEINFQTRAEQFESGVVLEAYDVLTSFWDPEASGSTVGTDNPRTTFTSSTTRKINGTGSGKLSYVFVNNSGGLCRVHNARKPNFGSAENTKIGVWVFGDLSYNNLEFWFYAPGSTNKIVPVCTIDWAGWELKTIPFSAIGGSGDRIFHSLIISQSAAGTKEGTLYFDDGQLITITSLAEEISSTNILKATTYPNPFNQTNTLQYELSGSTQVKIEIFNLFGQHIETLVNQEQIQGKHQVQWNPELSKPNGLYLYRIETSPSNNLTNRKIQTEKCLLIR